MRHINSLPKIFSDLLKSHFNRWLFMVRVEGESLWPHLVPGRRYIASALFRPRTGDFAVFCNPCDPSRIFVKKVQEIHSDGYIMASTVSWGSSSNDFGIVPRELILGRIVSRVRILQHSHILENVRMLMTGH